MDIPASRKGDAVSPVIGAILLVALTVVLIGIIGAVLMGFGMPEPAPILGIAIGSQGNIITVTHLNGAELPAGSYKILVDGADKTAAFGGTVDFGPGIQLRWDSETEKVGVVSVVYTSEKGVSTLIAEKRIGKAGSGGGDLTILHADGHTYSLSIFDGQWSEFKVIVSGTISGMNTPGREILYQDGKYWFVYDPCWLSKENALDSTYRVEDFNTYITTTTTGRWYPCMIEILNNEHVLTSADFSSGTTFKPEVLPLELGKLYTDGTNLYMYNYINATYPTVKTNYFTSTSSWEWMNIGTISST